MEAQKSQVYIHQKPESFQSKMTKIFLVLTRAKGALKRILAHKKIRNDPAPIPKYFAKKYQVTITTFAKRTLWTIGPKNGASNQVIFYMHGGSYLYNVATLHWNFLAKMVDQAQATIVVANYPIAPQATANRAYSYLHKLYEQVLNDYQEQEIIFMGDSAGGGLAIAFTQFLRDHHLTQPKQIIALSPWLDITLRNPDIAFVDKDDKMLEAFSLREAGKLFAGDMDITDPRVSPIYGGFNDLAKLSVFVGAHDIFVADCRKLRAKLEKENIAFNYYEYPKMLHTWALTSLKEAKIAFTQIVSLLED
ncbi:MAG TPA: hypothetical protein DCS93_01780 [Microscillaceae bacterium]|nr:hypothetical protein [Microscillaceae bacterium]